MKEREYIDLTKRVKLDVALAALSDLLAYTTIDEDTSGLYSGIGLLRTYRESIVVEIERKP